MTSSGNDLLPKTTPAGGPVHLERISSFGAVLVLSLRSNVNNITAELYYADVGEVCHTAHFSTGQKRALRTAYRNLHVLLPAAPGPQGPGPSPAPITQ